MFNLEDRPKNDNAGEFYSQVHSIPLSGGIIIKTRYGWVEIDNIRYDHDVIVHADHSVTKRSKKKSKKLKSKFGHTPLSGHELKFLEKEKPEVVFIGTGQFGDLPLTSDTHQILLRYTPIIRPTPDVLDLLADEHRRFVAILHVSC